MYFEITNSAESALPISCKISDNIWLHRQQEHSHQGYCLGNHGGNFVNFDIKKSSLDVNFGFYKDFILTQDFTQGILLSNIRPELTPISSSMISAHVSNSEIKFKNYDVVSIFKKKSYQSLQQVAITVKNIIVDNLKKIQELGPLTIAYSGGLDSGILALLAHSENLEFTAVVDPVYNLPVKKIPFSWCYSSLTKCNLFTLYSWPAVSAPHFYHQEFNRCVGGFYGDLSMLHHRDLFYQGQYLTTTNFDKWDHYDITPSSCWTPFRDYNSMLAGIIKLHLTPQFRQWFDNFEIFDAYRDPRLFEAVLQLNIDDLLLQFKTAYIQKYLIDNINFQFREFVCDQKNNYSKFVNL